MTRPYNSLFADYTRERTEESAPIVLRLRWENPAAPNVQPAVPSRACATRCAKSGTAEIYDQLADLQLNPIYALKKEGASPGVLMCPLLF